MNGIIYCRVSSKEQIEGTSLESQQLACREFARAKNIHVLKVFIERGESAKFADRTELLELIDFCRESKGKVQVLLVWKVDRFARNVGDHFNVKATLLKYGVRIVSVTEPIDTNPEGKLMETILAGFAQFDNDIRAMRTVQGMRRKIQEGIFPWKPPLGYKTSTRNGEKKTEPDQPDQPLFGLLQKAWKDFATGVHTKAEIRRLLTNRGVETKQGRPLSPQSLDNFFRNSYHAGILVDPWSGEEHEGRHIPMVSREDFARVQQVIARRSHSVPHQKERPEFPLRGVVRCPGCSHYLTGSFSRGRSRRYAYYHCHNGRCKRRGKGFPVDAFHTDFHDFLDSVSTEPELVEKLGELILQVSEERQGSLKTKKANQDGQLAAVKREIQELIRMRAQQLITDKEFTDQKAGLLERRGALEAAKTSAEINREEICAELRSLTEPLSHLNKTWQGLPTIYRRRFERLLLPAGFVAGKIRTAELGLLFATFRDLSEGNSSVVALVRKSWNRILQEIREFSDLLQGYQDGECASKTPVPRNSSE